MRFYPRVRKPKNRKNRNWKNRAFRDLALLRGAIIMGFTGFLGFSGLSGLTGFLVFTPWGMNEKTVAQNRETGKPKFLYFTHSKAKI